MDYLKGDLITYIDVLIREAEVKGCDDELELVPLLDKNIHYSVSSKIKKKALSQMINKLEDLKKPS